jgi:2-polyprenyl-6-hydroxyphenyl methylase/3-demethylubiquinone-9 3-methyltransferase
MVNYFTAVLTTTLLRGKSMQSTVDQKEIDTFAALSDKWWDMKGPMRPLHSFTPIRVDYITDAIRRIKGTLPEQTPLQNLRILDIGCGGGLLAEPMARLGGIVTGIDVTSEAIDAARTHAKASGMDISYHCQSAEDLAASGATFDVIYASEVIEHVADRQVFVAAIADMLAEDGVVVLTTINRTLPAIAFAKYALEYIVRIVPAGTHDPKKFVKPAELRAEFAAAGLLLDDTTGFAPRPGGFTRTASLAINYGISGGWMRNKR